MLRVVFLSPVAFLGGAEWSLIDLMASLRQTAPGLELHLVLGGDGPLRAHAKTLGVNIHELYIPEALASMGEGLPSENAVVRLIRTMGNSVANGPALVRYTAKLHRLLESIKPDIIHSNGMKSHMLTCLTRDVGAEVIWHLRDYLSHRAMTRRVLSIGARQVSAIAISQSVKEDVESCMAIPSVSVVYNAIDMARFSPAGAKANLDGMAGLTPARPGTLRIGIIGTFARWKGQDIFLQAAGKVAEDLPHVLVRYYIVGDAIYKTNSGQFTRQELSEMATRLGIGDKVGFTGHVSDVERLYRSLDVVVHASTQPEPFGRTIAEAMAVGRTLIVAGKGGARELFTEGHDALGATTGDPHDLARAIKNVLTNDELRFSLGRNARATAERRFDRKRLGPEVLAVYEQVLGRANHVMQPD